MPVSGDTRQALKLLERIRLHLKENEAAQLSPSVGEDLNTLLSVLDSPVFASILNIQDSLLELKRQLHKHPSILPVDFDISPTTGELLLSLPAEPIPHQNLDSFERNSDADQNYDYDGIVNSKANLKAENLESYSSEISPHLVSPPEYSLPAITTDSYAEEFQRTIDQGAQGREIHTLQLFKPEGSSLGFSVVGLRSEQKGELGIFIQEIQSNGIAGRDGRVSEGDQILAIDGQPLDSNISHQQAISILQQARGQVELIVARGGIPPVPPTDADMVLNTEWAQVEAIELLNDGTGLGFGIIGGRSTGVVVKTILPGGVADRDGRLQSGDHILQIGEVNLRGMGSEQVASVLRGAGTRARLVVARPADPARAPARAALLPTRALADPQQVHRRLALVTPAEEPSPYRGQPADDDRLFAYRRELDDPDAVEGRGLSSEEEPEMETFEVELVKDQQGLGITIAGYVCEKEEISGIFVKSIAKGSAADMCGQIRVNDQIIEVDGRPLHGYTNHDAVEVLRSTGKSVKLRLARYLRGAKYQQLQLAIASGELSYPSLPSIQAQVHEQKGFADSMARDLNGSDINHQIDEDYASPLSPIAESAIQSHWQRIMGPEYEIVVAQLSKFREGGGLGISLEGTVDVEDGIEVRPHHYIRSILPDGPVGSNGRLRSGDELLEVNGETLLGMNHHGVVATLKELPLHVRMVCARHLLSGNIPPSPSHMEYDLAPELKCGRGTFGGSLTSLGPASSERLVKAKSDGSLAVGSAASSSPPSDPALSRLKSRSLEPLTGLAMWSSEPQIIELMKGDRGLGFSILDYQDPMNPNETVIVIRSLVPGGVAQQDGRLIPGDRLLFVNDTNLENASLDAAVQALKGAPKGAVRIGVAKPLPLPESGQSGQMSLDSPPFFESKPSFILPLPPRLSLDLEQKTTPIAETEDPTSLLPSIESNEKDDPDKDFQLSPVKTIKIQKGSDVFGVSVSIVEEVGVMVTSVTPGSASDKDGRLLPGDVLVSLNGCSLVDTETWRVGEVFRTIDKSTDDVIVKYISADGEDQTSETTIDSSVEKQSPAKPPVESDEEPISSKPTTQSVRPTTLPTFPLKIEVSVESFPKVETSPRTSVSKDKSIQKSSTKPPILSPKPKLVPVPPVKLDVSSMVSKLKPTVPFKPFRSSLSPKDNFPATKSRIEHLS